jgi:hypothetical protein
VGVVVAVHKKMYEKDSLPDMLNVDSSCAIILSHGKYFYGASEFVIVAVWML